MTTPSAPTEAARRRPGTAAGSGDGTAWHALSTAEALQRQSVTIEAGLTAAEVQKRQASYGKNKFADAPKEPRLQAFLRQYQDPMQIVLLGAGILSLFIPSQFVTGILLIGLTLLNAGMGLNQEGKAVGERRGPPEDDGRPGQGPARRRSSPRSPMEDIVPGDIVNIEAGDLVPADGRILTAATLEIDESALTGESLPVPKQIAPVAADSALGDRVDMAFMNTQVTRGSGDDGRHRDRHDDRGRPHQRHAPGVDRARRPRSPSS